MSTESNHAISVQHFWNNHRTDGASLSFDDINIFLKNTDKSILALVDFIMEFGKISDYIRSCYVNTSKSFIMLLNQSERENPKIPR